MKENRLFRAQLDSTQVGRAVLSSVSQALRPSPGIPTCSSDSLRPL